MTAEASTSAGGSSGDKTGPPRGNPVYSVDPSDVIEAIQRPKKLPEDAAPHKGRLPILDLPSFGEPNEDCGDPTPGSMYFCPNCHTIHEKPHVCYQYDCPLHWAHAVRRRAAGAKDSAGVAPKLDALRRYLNAWRDDNQYFHHIPYAPPQDRRHWSKDALKREVEAIREWMDAVGLQGLVVYHPRAGDNEDIEGDDRGEWKHRIGKDTEWSKVKEELEYRPHFHIVGVAPFVDFSGTPEIHEETGAVLHRITQEDSNVSIPDTEAMCRVVTYCLSHAGIYETETGQRRLAAWMKGPDVHRVDVYERNKARIQAMVYEAARDTLGISPPNLECDEEVPPGQVYLGRDGLPGLSRPSEERPDPLSEMYARGQDPGPQIGALADQDAVTVRPQPAPSGWDSPTGPGSMVRTSAASSSSTSGETTNRSGADTSSMASGDQGQGDEVHECGTRLRHISQAGEFLTDPEWRAQQDDEDLEDLEAAYQSYVDWMTSKGLDPDEDPRKLPEERESDRPPDD